MNRPPVVPSPSIPVTAAPRSMQTTATPPPTTKGYFSAKFAKIKNHVLDRVSMFYLSRAPTSPKPPTTSLTTATQKTTTKSSPKSLTCPFSSGLFPYEGDCKKFINCWKGRPHVQACAQGTLFNAATLTCDHAAKVDCQSKILFISLQVINFVHLV